MVGKSSLMLSITYFQGDKIGRVVRVGPILCERTGLTQEEFVNKTIDILGDKQVRAGEMYCKDRTAILRYYIFRNGEMEVVVGCREDFAKNDKADGVALCDEIDKYIEKCGPSIWEDLPHGG